MKTSVLITGLICITVLELFALYKGVNGVLLTTVIGLIVGVLGLKAKTPKFLKD